MRRPVATTAARAAYWPKGTKVQRRPDPSMQTGRRTTRLSLSSSGHQPITETLRHTGWSGDVFQKSRQPLLTRQIRPAIRAVAQMALDLRPQISRNFLPGKAIEFSSDGLTAHEAPFQQNKRTKRPKPPRNFFYSSSNCSRRPSRAVLARASRRSAPLMVVSRAIAISR